MKYLSHVVSALAVSALPVLAFAQIQTTQNVGNNVSQIFDIVSSLADRSIGILVTIALAVFFYGLVRYLFKLGGEEGAKNGANLMIYGLVALFIMVSVWGLVNFIGNFFGISTTQGQQINSLVPRR